MCEISAGKLMLEIRNYSRQELIELYKTERLDYIKKKIKKEGYAFNDCGQGKNYIMKITALPDDGKQLEKYCIEELGFSAQVNFSVLKYFLYNFLLDESFMTLQFNEMSEVLKQQGIQVTPQTISNYYKHLESIGWVYSDSFDYVYYVYDIHTEHNIYITKEEYCTMYKDYWITVRENNGDFLDAELNILKKYGNKPKKRYKKIKNGFYTVEYNTVMELLEKEFSKNGFTRN